MPTQKRDPSAETGLQHFASEVGAALFSTPNGPAELALFAPLHYEPRYAYPLLVWLHGDDSDERQLVRIMPLVSMRNYVAVAPRGARLGTSNASPSHAAWPQDAAAASDADAHVVQSIEHARRKFHVAENRVFIAGFGSGGTMALRLAFSRPTAFAGVISLCGPMPRGGAPLASLSAARRVPVFLAAGGRSPCHASADVCDDLRLLHTAGMSVTLREYPCGHELAPQMLADVDRWIIEQITSGKQPD
ncbi:MAG: alpha/beta hydrolase [Planctomycetota bacterium]